MDDPAAATASGEATVALGAGEGEMTGTEIPDGAGGGVAQRVDLVYAPIIGGERIGDGDRAGEAGLVAEEGGGGAGGGFDGGQAGAEIDVMGDGGAGGRRGPGKGNRKGIGMHMLIRVGGHWGVGDTRGIWGIYLEAV